MTQALNEPDKKVNGQETVTIYFLFFKIFYLFIFIQMGRERERGRET